MGLPSKTFQQFVDDMVAAWAASLGFQPTLQAGDGLYALMQATSAQLVYLQAQVAVVNAVARAQTSSGADLDSFFAQFGFTRLPGQKAIGPVTLGRLSPATTQVLIPVGTIVQTQGGAIQYELVADTQQAAYNAALNAYVMAIGASSISATAQAALSGSAYNVTTGQLSQVATPVAGLDTVTNPGPIANGADAESDSAFRTRFVQFLNSLSKATKAAIESAISGVQQGIEYSLQENVDVDGRDRPGEFVATIDDGTGSPPQSLIDAVFAAVDAVRGFTIFPEVISVQVTLATIVITVKIDPTLSVPTVESAVKTAIVAMVDALGIGNTLYVSAVEQAALTVDGVLAVKSGTTINASTNDLAIDGFHAARTTTGDITVSSY